MNLFHEAKKVLDKDGKVNALGPYGKQKLTGREIQTYFRRNKVKDKVVRKAVEVALDLGGAMDIAIKAIKDYYGNKILKAKEVQTALKFANEESFRDSFDMLDEDYRKVIKMYPRDRDWKKLITKHKRAIDALRKNEKDLPKKVEDELLTWASQAGEVGSKDDAEDFIMSIIDEGTLSEGKNLMPDIQKIVDTKGAKKVGGIMVDMFTASMINQIYNKVNDSNKKKMEKSNISTLVDLAQRMMQKMGDNLGEGKGTDVFKKYNKLIGRLSDNEQSEILDALYTMNTQSGRRYKEAWGKVKELLNMGDNLEVNEIFGISQDPRYRAKVMKMLDDEGIKYKKDGRNALIILGVAPKDQKKLLNRIHKEFGMSSYSIIDEGVNLQEGTWAVPDSYPKLVKLQKVLDKKNIAKDAKTVHKFTDMIYDIFGDDSFFDDLGTLQTISKGGEVDQYDGEKHSDDYMKRSAEYAKRNKLKAGMDMNQLLMKHLSDWTGGVLKFKGNKIVQMPREWYFKDNPEHTPDNSPVKATLKQGDNVQERFKGFNKLPSGKIKRSRFKPIKAEAVSRAQQAAIAISKKEKEKKETVMDSYRKMWESQNLEEKKEFKQSDIDKVAKLTDRNEHTKSLIHIAKTMGDKNSFKKLQLIDKMHNEYGHMPKGLMDMRNEVYDDLKKGMEKYSNGKDMYGAT
jgi:hypothetical protein